MRVDAAMEIVGQLGAETKEHLCRRSSVSWGSLQQFLDEIIRMLRTFTGIPSREESYTT